MLKLGLAYCLYIMFPVSGMSENKIAHHNQKIREATNIAIDVLKSRNSQSTETHQGAKTDRLLFEAVDAFKKNRPQGSITAACIGKKNENFQTLCQNGTLQELDSTHLAPKSADILLAPHSLYEDISAIFTASENLLTHSESLPNHPFFTCFEALKEDGEFIATLFSGPTIQQCTDLLLGSHGLDLKSGLTEGCPSLKIFNSFELFIRCLDIFKTQYARQTGKHISYSLSDRLIRTPLKEYCESYLQRNPAILELSPSQREQFIRLLSVFVIDGNVADYEITIRMSLSTSVKERRSFKPIGLEPESMIQKKTPSQGNDISVGQQDLTKQIQNLNGSELSMPYIKDADGEVQLAAFGNLLAQKELTILDVGGGRGETNALIDAVQQQGVTVHLVNLEPYGPFVQPYIDAHKKVGVKDVQVVQKNMQDASISEIRQCFGSKSLDVILASHSFYFLLGELHTASCQSLDTLEKLMGHPLWKYFDLVRNGGKIIVTMQSGSGARVYRNMLLGNHGLSEANEVDTTPLLRSFGCIATFQRHLAHFIKQYEEVTGNAATTRLHMGVANVPLGECTIQKDSATGGYRLIKKNGSSQEELALAHKMFDFYGNWKDLEATACAAEDSTKRAEACKMQQTFLHIVRMFAPGLKNMQHPNGTLEITVFKKH